MHGSLAYRPSGVTYRDRTRTLFGQTMGLVAVTAAFFALGAYAGRNLTHTVAFGAYIAAFVILEGDLEGTPELEQEIREHVAVKIGKLARPKRMLWSEDLPKTRSGKIMRRLLRDIAEGREFGDVTTLRDPNVMNELEKKVAAEQAKEGE